RGWVAGASSSRLLESHVRGGHRAVRCLSCGSPRSGKIPVMQHFHLPLVLAGASVEALVVGAGRVALRRTQTLLEAGAAVRVVAPDIAQGFFELAARHQPLTVIREEYTPGCIGNAHLIIAATGDATVNARVASDAIARRRLVNVVDAPELGNVV